MTRTETMNLLESLKQAYEYKIKDLSYYGAFSGFLMALAENMLSDVNLGSDYWITQIQYRIEQLKPKQETATAPAPSSSNLAK